MTWISCETQLMCLLSSFVSLFFFYYKKPTTMNLSSEHCQHTIIETIQEYILEFISQAMLKPEFCSLIPVLRVGISRKLYKEFP